MDTVVTIVLPICFLIHQINVKTAISIVIVQHLNVLSAMVKLPTNVFYVHFHITYYLENVLIDALKDIMHPKMTSLSNVKCALKIAFNVKAQEVIVLNVIHLII
jgi:hypothetical protein